MHEKINKIAFTGSLEVRSVQTKKRKYMMLCYRLENRFKRFQVKPTSNVFHSNSVSTTISIIASNTFSTKCRWEITIDYL